MVSPGRIHPPAARERSIEKETAALPALNKEDRPCSCPASLSVVRVNTWPCGILIRAV